MKTLRSRHPGAALLLALGAVLSAPVWADLTIEQRSSFELPVVKAHGTSTSLTSGLKQRRDSTFACEGFLSMLCGHIAGGEIVRLDKDLSWRLDPAHRQYETQPFPTAAQAALARQKMQDALTRMQQCPAYQQQSAAPDTSRCELSPPRFDVTPTDQHLTIAGHDAKLTQVAMTQSCRDRQSGDTCDFVIGMDSWLTGDNVDPQGEEREFMRSYAAKMGFDAADPETANQLQRFLAPYHDQLKQLQDHAKDLKGYPLRTVMRIAIGGEHCAQAKQAEQQGGSGGTVGSASEAASQAAAESASGAATSGAGEAANRAAGGGIAGSVLGSAAGAFSGKMLGGLFKRKKDNAPAAAAAGATPAVHQVKLAEITVETTAIENSPIAADRFEIPAGWKPVVKKARNTDPDKDFTCPGGGKPGEAPQQSPVPPAAH